MNPIDDLRGNYKQFLTSETGKDFLTRIVAYETQLQMEIYRGVTSEHKLTNIDMMRALYWVRTQLENLSAPKPTPAVRGKVTRSPSQ